MKNSVIVIYVPLIETEEAQAKIQQDIQKMKDSDLHKGFDILYVGDPAREKVEVEVFFNPYQQSKV